MAETDGGRALLERRCSGVRVIEDQSIALESFSDMSLLGPLRTSARQTKVLPMSGLGMCLSLLGLMLIFFSLTGKNRPAQISDQAKPDVRGIGVILFVLGFIVAWL